MDLWLQEISIQHVVADLELTYTVILKDKNLAWIQYPQNQIYLLDKQTDELWQMLLHQ